MLAKVPWKYKRSSGRRPVPHRVLEAVDAWKVMSQLRAEAGLANCVARSPFQPPPDPVQ